MTTQIHPPPDRRRSSTAQRTNSPKPGPKPAAPKKPGLKQKRLEAIRRVVGARSVGTQEELCALLAAEGIKITQATLSRDLALLGAQRVSRPEGTVYSLERVATPSPLDRLREFTETVLSIDQNDALVVLRTRAGMASAVALAIDTARLSLCLGTLAGDDTIFATPTRGTTPRRLAHQLRGLFQARQHPAEAP